MLQRLSLLLSVHILLAERPAVNELELDQDTADVPKASKSKLAEGLLETASDSVRQRRAGARRTSAHARSKVSRFQNRGKTFVVSRTDALSSAKQAAMQRLFGRHTSQAEYVSHVKFFAKTNRSSRWDLAGGTDEVGGDLSPADASLIGSRYVNLTEDQRKQMKQLEQEELQNEVAPPKGGLFLSEQPLLMAVAGGIGASVGNTGSINFDRDLIRRMKMQDLVVMFLLMFVYFATLSFSACLAHRQAANRSRVKFYADPRMFLNTADHAEEVAFLEAFNQQPKQVQLRVTGYHPVTNNFPGSFFWRDGLYAVAFSFALDLTPWVVPGTPDEDADDEAEVGVLEEDLGKLRKYLASDTNDLSIVQMQKQIHWKCWDELAMNIKHQIRQSGFEGVLSIDRTENEEMCVYKNTQWANFMHGKALKVLLALSVVAWIFYVPYMWIRCTYLPIRCDHYIDISISDYWQHIAEGLSANGFLVGEGPQVVFPPQRQDTSEPESE